MLWILTCTALIVVALFVLSRVLNRPRIELTLPTRRAALPPCTIRVIAGADDVAACESIYRRNEPGRFPDAARGDFLAHIRSRDKALFLVAEVDGAIAGFGGITMDRKAKLEVAHLVYGMVDPAHQRRGIGTALLLARLAVLPAPRRWWTVLFVPIAGSESFYRRFGFQYGMTTVTAAIGIGDVYRAALTRERQAECIAVLGERLRVAPLGKSYIPGLGTVRYGEKMKASAS